MDTQLAGRGQRNGMERRGKTKGAVVLARGHRCTGRVCDGVRVHPLVHMPSRTLILLRGMRAGFTILGGQEEAGLGDGRESREA